MPRRKFINKKDAQTFSLVYRSQDDPRIHDAEASDMVFTEKHDLNRSNKIKQRGDLEEEFGFSVRKNEGEAANYGVYYDDSEYDYMQHLRDIGEGGEGHFVEAKTKDEGKGNGKGKGKMRLEDQLRDLDLESEAGVSHTSSVASNAQSLFSEDMLPSEFVRPTTYQDQQNVPDAIAGFQPDMDPRLREVLEALDDEAYVDDDEGIFDELGENAEEVPQGEWEAEFWDFGDDDEGWESDRTIKADEKAGITPSSHENEQRLDEETSGGVSLPPPPADAPPEDVHGDGDWMAEFSKFKKDAKSAPAQKRLDMQSSVITGATGLTSGRKKKRKGALTSTSGYSMSSSVLQRTEGQSVLDARFDKIEEEYADDEGADDSMSVFSGMTGMSKASQASEAPQLVRSDFNAIMGEFLGNHSQVGNRRRVRVGKAKTGLEQLDEIRQGLGPARLKTSSR